MRIIFMGNGPFARPALKRLHESAHEVLFVVARPDRPQGKKNLILPGPVAALATELGLPVQQPENVNDEAFIQELASHNADLLVVADFGQILSPACLAAARLGGVNIHGSLLPKYRGAAPIVWAVYNGDAQTGVTIIQMTPKLDAGAMIAQEAIPIGPEETSADVEARLSELGGKLVLEAIEKLELGAAAPIPQSDQQATKAPRVRKEDGLIDWKRSAEQIRNQVRAMIPWPIAYTHWRRPNGEPLRIQVLKCRASTSADLAGFDPGQVVSVESGEIQIQTGDGILSLQRLKPAGKGEMDAAQFLLGYPVKAGDWFQ